MKKNNKGFSLVELIIVIAIMAILAGALAPALIKYIAKSRRSTDVSNAQTIATAVTNVMTDTSIMQPLCKEMSNYWSPAENMGKNIQSGEVTKDNAAEKTEEMNTTMNTDVAE